MSDSKIFNAAVKLLPEHRAAYLDQACGKDHALRGEVEALLRANQQAGSFLRSHAPQQGVTLDVPPAAAERPGMLIGPYKLMEQIGEGGMGLVFVAEQQVPVRRKVALKVIKPGMDTREVIARFEAERQALALMDHPNIARVLDAGTTESGRPYFVMELVKGVPITDFCDQSQLTAAERLALFIDVCQAVQHAHTKGVIHRDLKPSNILIAPHDGKPVVKVIDFGVAKAVGQPLTDKTVYTRLTQMIGTPLYMSPEQAEVNALDVDTRSDVYALGVLLYELLTGATPFDRQRFGTAAFDEIRRIIREEEPPKPSTRLSTLGDALAAVSAKRRTEPAKLSALVRGDLDWIVMKSLEKDRSRRYETATALARDVERYLKDEPVEACPPTVGYRLRKFTRKHQKLLVIAVAFAALLLAGVAASVWQAVRATEAEAVALVNERQANANAQQAEQKEREAKDQRDEAQRQRDEVKALNEKLQVAQAQLRRTLYMAHMNLAQHAWDVANIARVQELLKQHRPRAGETDLRGFEWHYFNRLCHQEVLLIQTDGSLSGVAFSPDGMRLAAGLKDNSAKFWDARTGRELLTLKGHTWPITHMTFSPDGKLLATASLDNTVKVWDAQTGKELHTFVRPGGPLKIIEDRENKIKHWMEWDRLMVSVAFSPDSKRLAATSEGETIVWGAHTGEVITRIKVGRMSLSPDGERLAGLQFGRLVLFDVNTGKRLLSMKQQDGSYGKLIFSPNGKKLAAIAIGTFEGPTGLSGLRKRLPIGPFEVQVWDAQTGDELLTLKEHSDLVQSIAFSPDSQRLASASSDNTVKVWDANTGQELFTLKGHTIGVWDLAFRPDGKQLVTLGMDGTVRVWDLQPPAFADGNRSVAGISFSPDGKRVATAALGQDNEGKTDRVDVKVWDAQTARQLVDLKGFDKLAYYVGVVFSPDGKQLAGAIRDLAKIWDAQTGQELISIEDKRIQGGAAFSPDGKTLAVAGAGAPRAGKPAVLTLWDAQTGKELRLFKTMRCFHARPVAFSPDGKRLFVQGTSNPRLQPHVVIAWDVQTGEELFHIEAAEPTLAVSPDGKRLAGVGPDSTVKLWEAQTGKELLTLKGEHMAVFTSVAFSPDGERLVAASGPAFSTSMGPRPGAASRAVMKMWNAQTGEELLTLQGQAPVAFTPDGRRLFGLGPDGTVKIWDATPLPEKK